ncbi:hypothetical protein ASG63_21880 [Methylobacterium sp. Leaf94]|nr:hypothetical protein ASG63_21880 [Methylobacterium sp. Leaf94]
MQDVTALTERLEVLWIVVAGIVVEVGTGQVDAGGLNHCVSGQALERKQLQRAALARALGSRSLIPPAAVTQVNDQLAMWAAAAFTAPFGSSEADHVG